MSERRPITWAENADPTPEQFTDWFLSNDRGAQIAIADQLLHQVRRGVACFIENHATLRREVAHLSERLVNVRHELADELLTAWDGTNTTAPRQAEPTDQPEEGDHA